MQLSQPGQHLYKDAKGQGKASGMASFRCLFTLQEKKWLYLASELTMLFLHYDIFLKLTRLNIWHRDRSKQACVLETKTTQEVNSEHVFNRKDTASSVLVAGNQKRSQSEADGLGLVERIEEGKSKLSLVCRRWGSLGMQAANNCFGTFITPTNTCLLSPARPFREVVDRWLN